MNDFTKEELELLSDNLHYPVDGTLNSKIWEVYCKLQSLLDNYDKPKSSCCSVHAGTSEEYARKCEHEWYGGEAYGESAERNCKKCGEFYRNLPKQGMIWNSMYT